MINQLYIKKLLKIILPLSINLINPFEILFSSLGFLLSTVNTSLHSPLACMISDEKSAIILTLDPL